MKICKDRQISNLIASKLKSIDNYIESLTNDEIMSEQDDIIINNMYESYKIIPINIGDEIQENRKIVETKIQQYNPFYDMYPPHLLQDKYFYIDGVELTCCFPFSGDSELFYCKSATFGTLSGEPDIELYDGYFTLSESETLKVMSDEKNKDVLFKKINNTLAEVKKLVGWCNADAESFNASIKKYVESKLNKRKEKVKSFYNISKMLEIPIQRTSVKNIEEIKVERKIIPLVKKEKEQTLEYSISNEIYKDIISIIKHQCTTFERTPSVYTKLQEEELRDILLSTLNAVFKGQANSECFRKNGKTDICIEHENRAAFVTECKIWSGKKILADALFQLQSYTTWRDNKLCLIMFSRNKDFFNVLEEINNNLPLEKNYISHKELEKNVFELTLSSNSNKGQLIKVTVLAFDLSN